jgi:hypothetical protein
MIDMLNDVLQALEMLKRDKEPSCEVTDTIRFLKKKVKARTRASFLDLMAVADTFGHEELESDLVALLGLLRKMKESRE